MFMNKIEHLYHKWLEWTSLSFLFLNCKQINKIPFSAFFFRLNIQKLTVLRAFATLKRSSLISQKRVANQKMLTKSQQWMRIAWVLLKHTNWKAQVNDA